MSTTVFEIKNEMETLWKDFSENHAIYEEKGNKAAAARARFLGLAHCWFGPGRFFLRPRRRVRR